MLKKHTYRIWWLTLIFILQFIGCTPYGYSQQNLARSRAKEIKKPTAIKDCSGKTVQKLQVASMAIIGPTF